MKQMQTKYKFIIKTVIFIAVIIFITASCSKEEVPGKLSKDELINSLKDDISADTLKSLVTWMQGLGTRFALASNHRDIAVKIKNRFIRIGYPETILDSFLITKVYNNVTYNQWQYNVIATLEGITYPDSVCIIGGHYDNTLKAGTGDPFTTGYGANDNASGAAATLEIARVMKKNSFSPASTIKFIAYAAEELGLMGSYYQSGKSKALNEKIKLMLNNDMIAYAPTADFNTWYIDIMDYDNSHNLRKNAETITSKYTSLKYVNNNTYNKQSDSYPYFLNGYKSLFFLYASDPNYHTPNDLVLNCNFIYCRQAVIISCALLVDNNY
jgi:bacterial leucyl aminopeptidase